jgi:hypothetical protein
MRRACFLILFFASHASALSVHVSDAKNWSTRAIYFQDFYLPSVRTPDQIVFIRGETFVHPSGHRNSLELGATIPDFPVGLQGKIITLPSSSATATMGLEAGAFWYGAFQYLLGQAGVTYFQEALEHWNGREFVIPQVTVRTLFHRKRFDSIQHFSVPVPLGSQEPMRAHTFHSLAYIFRPTPKLHLATGFLVDVYLLFGNEPHSIQLDNTGIDAREELQVLFGPMVSLSHETFGEFSLKVTGTSVLTRQLAADVETFNIMSVPNVSVSYALGF